MLRMIWALLLLRGYRCPGEDQHFLPPQKAVEVMCWTQCEKTSYSGQCWCILCLCRGQNRKTGLISVFLVG